MTGRTPIDISGYVVDDDVTDTDDLFNLYVNSTLVLLGTNVLIDDAVSGAGRVSVRGPTTIDDGLTLEGSALFVDMSSVMQNGELVLGQSSTDAVTARNIAGATWDLNGGEISGAGSSQFVNLGLLQGSGTIDANFYDRGGDVQVTGQLTLMSSVNRFVDDTISGPGMLWLSGDATFVGSVISTNTDWWLGDARIVGDVRVSSGDILASYLNLGAGAVLTFTNPAAGLTLGEIIGPGEIDLRGDDSVFTSGTFKLVGAATFANFGNTRFSGMLSEFTSGFLLSATAWTGDQITIENEAGASWTASGTLGELSATGGGVTFYNDGTFVDSTVFGASFGMDVVNNGLIEPEASQFFPPFGSVYGLVFNDAVTGTGTIEVGTEKITAAALVGSGQTLAYDASSASLILDDVQDFHGLITGFDQSGQTDDQLVVDSGTWQYQDFVPNDSNTGGSLVFTTSSGAETLVDLSGSYQASGFHAALSGNKTTITYSA